jgi:hypothetical protein
VLFTQFTLMLDILQDYCERAGHKWVPSCACLRLRPAFLSGVLSARRRPCCAAARAGVHPLFTLPPPPHAHTPSPASAASTGPPTASSA